MTRWRTQTCPGPCRCPAPDPSCSEPPIFYQTRTMCHCHSSGWVMSLMQSSHLMLLCCVEQMRNFQMQIHCSLPCCPLNQHCYCTNTALRTRIKQLADLIFYSCKSKLDCRSLFCSLSALCSRPMGRADAAGAVQCQAAIPQL